MLVQDAASGRMVIPCQKGWINRIGDGGKPARGVGGQNDHPSEGMHGPPPR